MYVHVYVLRTTQGGRRIIVRRDNSLLPLHGTQGPNPGYQTFQQVPFPTQPSRQPLGWILKSHWTVSIISVSSPDFPVYLGFLCLGNVFFLTLRKRSRLLRGSACLEGCLDSGQGYDVGSHFTEPILCHGQHLLLCCFKATGIDGSLPEAGRPCSVPRLTFGVLVIRSKQTWKA